MLSLRRQILLKSFKIFDLLAMVFAFGVATLAFHRQEAGISFEQFVEMRISVKNFVLFIGFLLIWHGIFSLFGLYGSRRMSNRREEILDVVKATALGTMVILLAAVIFRISMVDLSFLATFWAASSGITLLGRLAMRYGLGIVRRRGRNLRHMVIVGTNPRAIEFAERIESVPELGYRLVGFIDDSWQGSKNFKSNGHKIVTDIGRFPAYLRNNVIDVIDRWYSAKP